MSLLRKSVDRLTKDLNNYEHSQDDSIEADDENDNIAEQRPLISVETSRLPTSLVQSGHRIEALSLEKQKPRRSCSVCLEMLSTIKEEPCWRPAYGGYARKRSRSQVNRHISGAPLYECINCQPKRSPAGAPFLMCGSCRSAGIWDHVVSGLDQDRLHAFGFHSWREYLEERTEGRFLEWFPKDAADDDP